MLKNKSSSTNQNMQQNNKKMGEFVLNRIYVVGFRN